MTNMWMDLEWTNHVVITLCILFCGVVTLYVTIRRRTNRMMPMLKRFNQAPTLPIIGSLHLMLGGVKARTSKLLAMTTKLELPAVLWMMHIPVVLLGKKDDIQIILNTTREKTLLGVFDRLTGNSLLTLNGKKWRRIRRLTTPAFSPDMFHRYLSVFNKHSALLVKQFEPLCDTNEAFDLIKHVLTQNFNSVIEGLAGYKEQAPNESQQMSDAISKALQMETMRFTIPFLLPKILYEMYLCLSGKKKIYNTINQFRKKVVQDKLVEYHKKRHDQHDKHDEYTGAAKPETLIDSLIKLHTTDVDYTERHIQMEIFGTIGAGYVTTSATLCNTLLMLAMHLKVQEKVHDEIKTIFGDDDREVQMEDVNKLVYMEQCINETLRRFPTVPVTVRIHNEDIALSDNLIIPAGCMIFMAHYASHHDKEFFPNPDNWDPEHFSPERYDKCKKAFFPFGGGPRRCVASKYAMMSMKTQLVYLLRRYRFTTDMKMQDIQLELDISMRNGSGYWLKLHSMQKN